MSSLLDAVALAVVLSGLISAVLLVGAALMAPDPRTRACAMRLLERLMRIRGE